jgi:transposase
MEKEESPIGLLHPNAAGIDISSTEHYVAVNPNKTDLPIRCFGAFTEDLEAISNWLTEMSVNTVAMEATGIYWVTLFLHLQEKGFDVILVNAKHMKNVRGKKTDVKDAEWIRQLHSCGLLHASFQPDLQTRELRSYMRHRDNLVKTNADSIRLMQKAFEQMNIKLHTVISDITGKSGQLMIQAIIDGERDPEKLANLADKRVPVSKKPDIIKSLVGIWKNEHLFELKQAYALYIFNQKLIEECDCEIDKILRKIGDTGRQADKLKTKENKSNIGYNINQSIIDIVGTDLSEIYGLSPTTIVGILSEVGTDLSEWPTSKHFTSWLNLCPNNKVSGGKILKSKREKKKNRASQFFKLAANSIIRSKHYLAAFYHKIKNKRGAGKAIVATARKIAIIFYQMVTKKEKFIPYNNEIREEKIKENKIKNLMKTAKALGLKLELVTP